MLALVEREFVSIGASIGAGCEPCLTYHVQAAASAGATRAALLKAVEDAECVRRSATGQVAALSRDLIGLHAEPPADCCDTSDRAKELAAIGAAVGANSMANLRKHLEAGQLVGLTARHANEAVQIARAVQRRAAEFTADEAARLLPDATVAWSAPLPQRPAAVVSSAVAAHDVSPQVAAPIAEDACGSDCGCGSAVAAAAPAAAATCGPDCGCQSVRHVEVGAVAAAAVSAGDGACVCG